MHIKPRSRMWARPAAKWAAGRACWGAKPDLLCSLGDLNDLLRRNTIQRASRPYYYRYYNQLAQTCPAVYEMQVSVLNDLSDLLTKSFQNFVSSGILKKDFLHSECPREGAFSFPVWAFYYLLPTRILHQHLTPLHFYQWYWIPIVFALE